MNKRYPNRQKLLGYILGERGKLELTNSLEDLAQAAQRFRDRRIDILAINGGDGTISRTITAFIKAYGSQPLPKILILRGGTINLLAGNLGISGSPESILVRYMESMSELRKVRVVRLNTLEVNQHYGFLFGNGLPVNFLKEFYQKKTGPLGAIWLMVKIYIWFFVARGRYLSMMGWRRYRFLLDQRAIDLGVKGSLAVMASTVEKMPLGPRLFPFATKPGTFQFFSMGMRPEVLIWLLPFVVLRNRPGRWLGRFSRLASSLSLECQDQKNQEYTLDGELFDAQNGKLEIKLGPAIDFIVV